LQSFAWFSVEWVFRRSAAVDVDCNFDDVMLPGTGAEELRARLRLAVGRRRGTVDGTLKFGDLVLHAGQAFTRTRLMQEAWGYDGNGRVRTVDVHIRRLRAKLGTRHEFMVGTVRGVGYRAATPPQPEWVVADSALTSGAMPPLRSNQSAP